MNTNKIKKIFLSIFLCLVAISCSKENNPTASQNTGDGEQHIDAEGFILENDGQEVYREFQGGITNNLSLTVGQALELSVHFLDDDGNELTHAEEEEHDGDELVYEFLDSNQQVVNSSAFISIIIEGHEDHEEDHCDELLNQSDCDNSDHCEWHTDEGLCEDVGHNHEEEHYGLGFTLTGLTVGIQDFRIKLMHGTHADYTSLPISVTVAN
tara:strand:+ start:271 stop:903 length:633 start_codon:yes stop_codon:yes gene_type:complete